MGRDEVRKALEAMDDDSVRAQMAAGDLSAVEPAELTDEERAMIVAAADDYPEVAGFSFAKLTNVSDGGLKVEIPGQGIIQKVNVQTPLGKAANYAYEVKI